MVLKVSTMALSWVGKATGWEYQCYIFLSGCCLHGCVQSKFIGLFTAKKIINKKKKQLAEWENIFGNDSSDKDLISKIY